VTEQRYLSIYVYKYGPSHIILHQHVSVTLATIIVVSYNKNTTSVRIIVQKCMRKQLIIAFDKRGADKSLARPGRKQATFPAFCGTWRFITTFTRVHHLSLP